MRIVAIVAAENCLSSVVYGVQDIFAIANEFMEASDAYGPEDLFRPVIVGTDKTVTSFSNVALHTNLKIDEVKEAEFIIVTPIGKNLQATVQQSTAITNWLGNMAQHNARLCGICTGVFLLAATGLLDGKQATTNPNRATQFHKHYPTVDLQVNRLITDSGDILCCGATYAFVDLIIYLIEKECGSDIAIQCARNLVTDKNRTDQRPYIPFQPKQFHHDKVVRAVQERIHENYQLPLPLGELASAVGVSMRNLTRRFKVATDQTPKAYLQAVRIDKTREMLEMTDESFENITVAVGYEDVRSFGRLFAKKTGLSPKVYRERFQTRR